MSLPPPHAFRLLNNHDRIQRPPRYNVHIRGRSGLLVAPNRLRAGSTAAAAGRRFPTPATWRLASAYTTSTNRIFTAFGAGAGSISAIRAVSASADAVWTVVVFLYGVETSTGCWTSDSAHIPHACCPLLIWYISSYSLFPSLFAFSCGSLALFILCLLCFYHYMLGYL